MNRRHIVQNLCAIFLISIFTLLSGCKDDPNHQFIQGSWINLDEHLQQVVGERHLETVWNFSGNRYRMEACCFIEAAEQGMYYVIDSKDNRMILELRVTSGYIGGSAMKPGTVQEIEIFINYEDEMLHFQRADFSRYSD